LSDELGTLGLNEHHPSVHHAFKWLKQILCLDPLGTVMTREALASCSIEGNKLAEVCGSTLDRMSKGEDVGERYVFGLAWHMMRQEISHNLKIFVEAADKLREAKDQDAIIKASEAFDRAREKLEAIILLSP
jgi:hypothetical protein